MSVGKSGVPSDLRGNSDVMAALLVGDLSLKSLKRKSLGRWIGSLSNAAPYSHR